MRIKYTIHRKAELVGTVETVSDSLGERLISAGHAVRAEDGPVARPAARAVPAAPARDSKE